VRILIVKTSSMGDVVHALPLAADIARAQPGATIDWVVEEAFAAIPRMSRHIASVHSVALRRWRHAPLAAATRAEVRAARTALRAGKYDVALDAQGLLKSAWIARWSGASIAGFTSNSARERWASLFYQHRFDIPRTLHAVARCRALGAAALGYAVDGPPRFDVAVGSKPAVAVQGPYAVLLTNASRVTKLWPNDCWVEVERWLADRGMLSLLFAGNDAEGARTRQLAEGMRRAVVAPASALDSVAASLAGARVVIGVDTGLSHLAAALGRPTVAIYCDYDPALVGLVGDGPHSSLGGDGVSTSAAQAIEAAERVLASS
jgi:heptosyltransferase-1